MSQECTKCHRKLPSSNFCKNSRSRTGLNYRCRDCSNPKDPCACGGSKKRGSSTCLKCRSATNSIRADGRRRCRRCMQLLSLSCFHKASPRSDGLQTWCKSCVLETKRESHAKEPHKVHNQVRRWRQENPDKALRAATAYLKKYSLTFDDYASMLDDQDGYCANLGCINRPDKTRFHVDHDHACCNGNYSCGRCIRGLLCPSCNKALGLLRDNVNVIQGLSRYVLGERKRTVLSHKEQKP